MAKSNDMSLKDVRTLLEIPPSERSEKNLIRIASYFNCYKFFNDLTGNTVDKHLYRNITPLLLKKNHILFNYGDQASAFYFVISGSVDVYVPIKGPSEGIKANFDGEQLSLKKVSSIGPGGTFGELALIAQRPRAGTIKAGEDCILAVCDRKTYIKCIQEKEKYKLGMVIEKVNALLPLRMEKTQLMKLVYFLKPLELNFNNLVYEENHSFTYLYIIMEGEVKVR